jgi:hypothetical protein
MRLESQESRITKRVDTMSATYAEIRVKGKSIRVSSVQIGSQKVVSDGKWLRVAAIHDEELQEGPIDDPGGFLEKLKDSGLKADIFSYSRTLLDFKPTSAYHLEWDSMAVVPITTYAEWWEKRTTPDVRSAVKKAGKLGVIVKETTLDDNLVEGIVRIYNESEHRQGKHFWHYGKDFDAVKEMKSTYPDRSTFIGAYFEDELIGFIKMVRVGNVAKTLHVISMKKHFNKKATNALLAKAVEICAARGNTQLMYGNYIYKDPASSLTEFKRRNGFENLLTERYLVPLTFKGKLALKMGLQNGLSNALPLSVWRAMSRLRERVVRFRAHDKP